VCNSSLTAQGRASLERVADTVWARENVGFDVWAYKEAMRIFGTGRLAGYDELILMNYTFFGPIFPFSETFEKMDARDDIDFWGVTAHKRVDPNPFPGTTGELPMHIQSHWIAVRNCMFTSLEFTRYWDAMPMIRSYEESILAHESRFTQHFSGCGFRYAVTFEADHYPSDHPVFESAVLMLRDRCPILKRRMFFHEPTYLDREAILGRRVMQAVAQTDYPEELIWRSVVRSAEPRTLYTNMSLVSVIPDIDTGYRPEPSLRICVLAHIFYEDMTDEMMASIGNIPSSYDLVVTTTSVAKQGVIESALEKYRIENAEVRVVASNRGRAESAFIIGCRDVLLSGRYDLVLKVHSKRSPQNGYNRANLFKHHSIDNLLSSPGYIATVLGLFADQSILGMVFPPVVNIGFPTLGHSWFTNRPAAAALAQKLGIHTVFDRTTPVAPYGTMFWARPEALLKLSDHPFEFEDFAAEDAGWSDGMLGHVLERLYGYAVMEAGYTVRAVLNTDWAEINYAFLEYKLQRISSLLPPYTQEQVDWIEQVYFDNPRLMMLEEPEPESHRRSAHPLEPVYRAARHGFAAVARPGRHRGRYADESP
jgi:rhamnosyltransferase